MKGTRRGLRLLAAQMLVLAAMLALFGTVSARPLLSVSSWYTADWTSTSLDGSTGTLSGVQADVITRDGYNKATTLAIGYHACRGAICWDSFDTSTSGSVSVVRIDTYWQLLQDSRSVALSAPTGTETCVFLPEVALLDAKGGIMAVSQVDNGADAPFALAGMCAPAPAP